MDVIGWQSLEAPPTFLDSGISHHQSGLLGVFRLQTSCLSCMLSWKQEDHGLTCVLGANVANVFSLDVIDLTGDDKDDLQRAIALSLAESSRAFRETGITDEEQAISRWATTRPSAPPDLELKPQQLPTGRVERSARPGLALLGSWGTPAGAAALS